MANAGESVGKREPSFTPGGDLNWHNHCGNRLGLRKFLRRLKHNYHVSQLQHAPICLKSTHHGVTTHVCRIVCCSQQVGYRTNLGVCPAFEAIPRTEKASRLLPGSYNPPAPEVLGTCQVQWWGRGGEGDTKNIAPCSQSLFTHTSPFPYSGEMVGTVNVLS